MGDVSNGCNAAVRKYLESLQWDGKRRIAVALGVSSTAGRSLWVAGASVAFFESAVRRAFEPGCAVDKTLVLTGPQGCGKSTFLRALGGEWYVGAPNTRDDFVVALMTRWIVEVFGERAEECKAPFAALEDTRRLPFSKEVDRVPRASVTVFTANDDAKKVLGPSRRFVVVEVDRIPDPTPVRDQLWAEAVHRYKQLKAAPQHDRSVVG